MKSSNKQFLPKKKRNKQSTIMTIEFHDREGRRNEDFFFFLIEKNDLPYMKIWGFEPCLDTGLS